MSKRILTELEERYVHFGNNVLKMIELFGRKQESDNVKDDKFFSKYWQVYAWAAIIGFVNDKREIGASLPNQSSFEFLRIRNGSESVAHALVLMALSKLNPDNILDEFQSRNILRVISEFAEGGAKHILEIRETPGKKAMFNAHDDYFSEILERN